MMFQLSHQQQGSLVDSLTQFIKAGCASGSHRGQLRDFYKAAGLLGLRQEQCDLITYWAGTQCRAARDSLPRVRILHPIEKEVLSPEAYGCLLELSRFGILTSEQFEQVLNQCMMQTAFPIGLPQIKTLVANVLDRVFEELETLGSH